MGFTKKTWKNRIAEYINRRLITMEDGSTNLVTVARDEGTISQEGDAFNAANMNDLEDRIEAGFADVTQSLGSEEISSVGTNVKNAINNLYYTSATILGGLNRILHSYDAATGRFSIQFVFSNNDIHAITFGMSDIQYTHWDGSQWTIIWTK